MNETKSPIALVLSGGGALGAAHVGVMKALETTYYPEYLIGTSAGAIIAAALACEMSPQEISDFLTQKSLLKVAFDFSIKGNGIIKGAKILDLLKKVYQEKNFEDLPSNRRLRVVATDFNSGDSVILNTGSIAEAVRASLAVPGLFEPFWLLDKPLVDGGLSANLPLEQAIHEYQGQKIFAVDVCTSMSKTFPPIIGKRATLRNSIERTIRIMFLRQQAHIPKDSRVTLIRPQLEKYHSADILHLKQIEEIGYQSVEK